MSLITSMSHALAGLRINEAGLETVSRNVAGAGVQGYARRRIAPVEMGQGGVTATDVQRVFDSSLQRQLRSENGGYGFTSVAADMLGRLDASFGEPGGAGALDTLMNGLTSTLRALASEPGNPSARGEVVNAAKALAGGLNRLSADVQGLRNDTESAIANHVLAANSALKTIERIENQLANVPGGQGRADLLDERDRAIDALSKLMDVRVSSRGDDRIAIFTSGGAALFTGKASQLRFEPKDPLNAHTVHASDPAQSGVGALTLIDGDGAETPLHTGVLRGGQIAGLIAMRDETLPALQAGLDSVAAGLAEVTSQAGVPLFVDLGNGVASLPYTGGAQEIGFSARIGVDPALARDPTPLAPGGAPANAQALLKALTETDRTFASPIAGAPTFTGDPAAGVRNLLNRQAGQAAEAQRIDEGQGIVVTALNQRFTAQSGVSVDEEMAQLVELQNAYAANARVVSVVQDMYDALLRM